MPNKSSVLPRGFKTEAEKIAEKYRTELGISTFEAFDAFILASHLNVPIFSVREIFEENYNCRNFSILSDIAKFNAMWMPNSEGIKIIIHNDNHSPFRQQSNLMHELSHIIRKHEIPEEKAKLCHQFNLHFYNPLHEQEAKYLGGCLQITREGLLWAIRRKYDYPQISNHFKASLEMVRYRINSTGVERQVKGKK